MCQGYHLDENPLLLMALAVTASNAIWFAYYGWTMDAYKMGVHAWGYPIMKNGDHE